jgi:hypothetical protein
MPPRQSKRWANISHQANILFLHNFEQKAVVRTGGEKGGTTAPPPFSPLYLSALIPNLQLKVFRA